jgi:hypothetical protein
VKKRARYFNRVINERKGLLIDANPLAVVQRQLPISAEYYIEERQGYQAGVILYRDPLLGSHNQREYNELYRQGLAFFLRWKFYHPVSPLSVFYWAPEVRYQQMDYRKTTFKLRGTPEDIQDWRASQNEKSVSGLIGYRIFRDITSNFT